MNTRLSATLLILILAVASAPGQTPLGTGFTYQGRLNDAGMPFNGNANFMFSLYAAAAGGNLIGTQPINSVAVTGGLFTVVLNAGSEFGPNAFNGDSRWLEISVNGRPLSPRQEIRAAPYALQTRGIFVSANGNVGIGNTSPVSRLAINGGLYLLDDLDEDVSFVTGNYSIRSSDTSNLAYRYMDDPEQHDFFIGGTNRMTIASNGNVGIGTANPASALDVAGTAKVTGNAGIAFDVSNASTAPGAMAIRGFETALTGNTYGVFAVANSTSGIGVLGRAAAGTGGTSGVYGQNFSTTGYGVFGSAQASTGINYGVYGTSDSPSGYGVLGENVDNAGVRGNASGATGVNYGVQGVSSSASGRGVYGETTAASGFTYGVYGTSASAAGRGVFGNATADSGDTFGVWGQTDSPTGRGVYGNALGASGANYGVYGRSDSVSGVGVYGVATTASGATYGGYFQTSSPNGRGVYAAATGGTGVYGIGDTGVYGSATFGEYGVYGRSQSGWAVYALGDFAASGNKLFRIDHPTDPENKYLLHYCAEGPEPLNIYSGTAHLDGDGQAWVELPHYFSEINKDPRIQLTPAGSSMPDLFASEEVLGDRFQIAGGRPNGRVYWEVKATRNDPWTRTRGTPVETDKPEHERGKYQHPELYGQPPEMGMDCDAERERSLPTDVSASTPR